MQKYKKGDHVRVAKELGSMMSHFNADCEAIIIGSYKDQYGGDDTKSYTIHIKGHGEVSWYEEDQLTLIEKNRLDLLKLWEDEEKEEEKQKSDLDWIFSNTESVFNHLHNATVYALAECLGFSVDDLWGPHGEGYVFFKNAHMVLNLAKPFLTASDKDGWLKFCEELKRLEMGKFKKKVGKK